MTIKSPAFEQNQSIPVLYTCEGDDINPSLVFSDIPENTKSLALIMSDPDAPRGTFTHWLIWNISPELTEIEENEWPEGAEQGLNDGGSLGYMGPCPGQGIHHYHFTLYALSKKLDVNSNIKKEGLEREIETCLIEKAELMGLYRRQN
ncbi:MAG: Phospholipid-binding protein, PBP family [Candidatus Woesebacteria bacterium GW2011_GWB1_38_5b]|uniref:Phospholipid-binding protein, PBP family n=1 Tax=Candidatus Woesebacteria bacterium GW2011_GWB1_38_5b TaxID=1618569 RepID=A0A0G0NEL4_9BACT|nr:MAG: Phospholipid-binding protein, PBP family [Candidatus Woesebacteria bacterium GW2011_GWB1_38_5b]OGH48171.1 MAG: hypothetical protein A3A51_04060 [Candidatus Levybacteria bacterium RIFCSPLOWO2_01_FULL_39_10]